MEPPVSYDRPPESTQPTSALTQEIASRRVESGSGCDGSRVEGVVDGHEDGDELDGCRRAACRRRGTSAVPKPNEGLAS